MKRLFCVSVPVLLMTLAFAPLAEQTQSGGTEVIHSWEAGRVEATKTTTEADDSKIKLTIIRDVDNPDRLTPLVNFYSQISGNLGDGSGGCGRGWGLDEGARIIIEQVSEKVVSATQLTSSAYVAVAVTTSDPPNLGDDESEVSAIHIPLQPQGQHYPTNYHYLGAQAVRLQILSNDDWLCERTYPGPGFDTGTAHFSFFGYYVPAP